MFALAAFIVFLLALFELPTSINLIALGLALVALHLMVGWWPVRAGVLPWHR